MTIVAPVDRGSNRRAGTDGAPGAAPSRRSYTEMIMGLPISIHLRGIVDRATEARAVQRVWDDLRTADHVFSTYRDDSDISRIARGEIGVDAADPAVREVLDLAEEARRRTAGAFDVCYAGRLDPSGIVKGWAAARAARHLDLPGVDWYLNAGGDIALHSDRGRPPWRVGIEDPADTNSVMAVVDVADCAIATSGGAHRGAHIVDPRTGAAAAGIVQATVVGPDLVWADVFATAFVAAGSAAPGWSLPPGYECLLVTDTGAVMGSAGMPALLAVPQSVDPARETGGPRMDAPTTPHGTAGLARP